MNREDFEDLITRNSPFVECCMNYCPTLDKYLEKILDNSPI